MRSALFGATSLLAALAPAIAHAQTNGYVDIALGQTDIESTDLDSIMLGGAVAADVSDGWRVQFDVDTTRYSDGSDPLFTTTNVAAHVYRGTDTWAVGGVLANTDYIFGSAWTLGIEGQTHLGQLVLEGEAGLGTLEAFGDETDVVNANVNATYYVTDDFSLGVGVAYFDADEFDDEFITYSLDGEYKFQGSAFSMFAEYAQTEVGDVDSDTWRIGGRYAFGDDTLRGRRQTGPRWLRNSSNVLPIA